MLSDQNREVRHEVRRRTRAVQRFAKTEGVEWVDFAKGQR